MSERLSLAKVVIWTLVVALTGLIFYIAFIKKSMFILWPNTVLLICVALIGAILGFVIYGSIKGFKNTFPND